MVTGWVRMGVIALVGLAVLVSVGLWARSNSGATAITQPGTMMQTNEMDTHVVNLDGYDLKQLAVLRTDQGQEIQPVSWNAPTGGHHRSGTLTFPATLADGTPLIGSNTRNIELVIRNVGGVPERTLKWTL